MLKHRLEPVLTGVVFLSAVAGSSYTWFQLALHTNWVPWLAWVPFVAIDVGGLIFGANWINGRTVKIRAWGKITTLLAVAISVVGNGLEHAIAGGFLPVTMPLTVSVGAIAPAAVFAVVHQYALKRQAADKARKPVEARRTPKAVASENPVVAPPPPVSNDISRRGEQRAAMVEWIRQQDSMPPIKRVAEEFGVHPTTAKRARADARSVG